MSTTAWCIHQTWNFDVYKKRKRRKKNQIEHMCGGIMDTTCHRTKNLFSGVRLAWSKDDCDISELRLGRSLLLTDVSVERRGSLEKAHFWRWFLWLIYVRQLRPLRAVTESRYVFLYAFSWYLLTNTTSND